MLDTNACIGVIRNDPRSIRDRLQTVRPEDVAVSEIVRFELEYGVCRSQQVERNRANLNHFLRYVQVLEWAESQSRAAAEIRCLLAQVGQPIGPYDVLIAAHARSVDATLVTHNSRGFAQVPELQIEDWESM